MSETGKVTGRCLCGSVEYTASEQMEDYGVCHCDACRRWASGPFFATNGDASIKFKGEENISRYKSSDWAERGFCKNCGSNLFYYLVPTGQYMMAVGTLDDQASLIMHTEVFIDEKPASYDFANETEKMTGEEVFAFYETKE